jgi:hypothetical protein
VPIELSTLVKQAEHQVSCNLNDEAVILNLKSTLYFGLDKVGAYIWQRLCEPRAVDELCRGVLERYDIDEARCYTEVMEFLAKLGEAGLIDFMPAEHVNGKLNKPAVRFGAAPNRDCR